MRTTGEQTLLDPRKETQRPPTRGSPTHSHDAILLVHSNRHVHICMDVL